MTGTPDKTLYRIKAAKTDKARQAYWLDEILRLGMPTYRRVNTQTDAASRVEEQDDLFDVTLQTVMEDFASDMIQTFTPRYERWVRFEPAEDLSEGERRSIGPQLQALEDKVFAEIERSNYWSAAQECFMFWAASRMTVAVNDRGPLNPIHFQPIEIPDTIVERGADGSTELRAREMKIDDRGLNAMWPNLFPPENPNSRSKPKTHTVFEGCCRDRSVPGEERWTYFLYVDDKLKDSKAMAGQGAAMIISCPFRDQADTAWGPGCAHKAAPMARTLDELAYLNLKALNYAVDPITSYEEDGVTNVEGGLSRGSWVPRAVGSKKPEALTSEVDFRAMVFSVDDLRKGIKRAMYQDRPEQEGLTPPTATQWTDEKYWETRRRELPRDRCVMEWVLPIIQRVMFILEQRGDLPKISLSGNRAIAVRPVSPLSKAKDLEDFQITQQLFGAIASMGTALQAGVPINPVETVKKMQSTLKERNIVMLSEEEIAQLSAAQSGGAPPPEGPSGPEAAPV